MGSAVLCSPARHGYYHGYHHGPILAYAHPKCTKTLETVTKELCRIELEKSCTTETKTFTKITGFEKGDCKEIEICKDVDLCSRTPKEVCEDKEIKVPKIVCEEKKEE